MKTDPVQVAITGSESKGPCSAPQEVLVDFYNAFLAVGRERGKFEKNGEVI